MRIAIVGIRGVPANYGGSETAVEEIGVRLVQRGHEITVYCRRHKDTLKGYRWYKGIKRVVLPSINTLNLDMFSHSFLCLMHMLKEQYEVVHFHGVGNALLLPFLKITGHGAKSLLIVDGPDWKRPKWGKMAQLAFRISFPMAVPWADEIISDNVPVQDLFREQYGRETQLVGYGADLTVLETRYALEKYGLEANNYILQVAAIVPDKGVHVLVDAYERLETDMPLIIVGDTPYMTKYKEMIQSTKDTRIRFLGYVYGLEYRELVKNCYMYIHPLIVDGTSPALLQAMAYGCCVIGSDLPEINGTLSDAGPRFRSEDSEALQVQMASMLANPDQVKIYGQKARQRIIEHFNWDLVTDKYEEISRKLVNST